MAHYIFINCIPIPGHHLFEHVASSGRHLVQNNPDVAVGMLLHLVKLYFRKSFNEIGVTFLMKQVLLFTEIGVIF